ncbi:MAG: hypothetical protein AAF926_01615 [Pseudomonadota bacterium]
MTNLAKFLILSVALVSCAPELTDEQRRAESMIDCDVAHCVRFNSQAGMPAFDPMAETVLNELLVVSEEPDESSVSDDSNVVNPPSEDQQHEYGIRFCDTDFSQWDYAALVVMARITSQSSPIGGVVFGYTPEGQINGNISVRYSNDGAWNAYTATMPLNPNTDCLEIKTVITEGPFSIELSKARLALFKNDAPYEFPTVGQDNDWYAMKIVQDYIRADQLHPSHVEIARDALGDTADILQVALARGADKDELFAITVAAEANKNVLHDYVAIHSQYFLDRALARKQLPGLRSLDLAWDWSYPALASAIAFERTNDARFATLILEQYDALLSVRDSDLGIFDPYLGKSLRAWGGQRPGEEFWWVPVTNAGLISYPMLKILAAIDANFDDFDAVYGTDADAKALKALYLDRKERYLESFKQSVEDLDILSRTTEAGGLYYIANGAGGEVEALNHTHPIAAGMLLYHAMTGDVAVLQRAEKIAKYFEHSLVHLDNGSCPYPYAPTPDNMTDYLGDVENIWKVNITLLLPYEAFRLGQIFDESVKTCLGTTLAENVFGDIDNPNSVLSPDPQIPMLGLESAAWVEAPAYGMLAMYGDFDDRIEPRIVELVADHPELFPNGWLHRVMMVGYAARLSSEP